MADDTVRWVPVREPADVTEALIEATLEVIDGWYSGGDVKIDWDDVIDRVDGLHLPDGSRIDLGSNLASPAIVHLKKEVRRRLRAG